MKKLKYFSILLLCSLHCLLLSGCSFQKKEEIVWYISNPHFFHIDEIAAELKVPVLGKMPIDMDYATKADGGFFAAIDNQYITDALAVMPK